MDGVGAHEVLLIICGMDEQTDQQVKKLFGPGGIVRWICARHQTKVYTNFCWTCGGHPWHTHSQLVAIPFVPEDVREKIEGMKKYRHQHHVMRCKQPEISEKGELAFFVLCSILASRFL